MIEIGEYVQIRLIAECSLVIERAEPSVLVVLRVSGGAHLRGNAVGDVFSVHRVVLARSRQAIAHFPCEIVVLAWHPLHKNV